jgi:hypothetical protein
MTLRHETPLKVLPLLNIRLLENLLLWVSHPNHALGYVHSDHGEKQGKKEG